MAKEGDIGLSFIKTALGIEKLFQTQLKVETRIILYDIDFPNPRMLKDWDDAFAELSTLDTQIREELEGHRRNFLLSLVRALRTISKIGAGYEIPYRRKVGELLEVPGYEVAQSRIQSLRDTLSDYLKRAGYSGELAEAVARWEKERVLTPERLVPEFNQCLVNARADVNTKVMKLPEGTHTDAIPVHDVPWDVYYQYESKFKGKVMLNADVTRGRYQTTSWAKHYACHEVYPGHHTVCTALENLWAQGKNPKEYTVFMANSPHSPIFEGIAENAINFLGWVQSNDDLIYETLNKLRWGVSVNAAVLCNEKGASREEGVEYLMKEGYFDQLFVEVRMSFIIDKVWNPYIFSYWYGAEAVRNALSKLWYERTTLFKLLYGKPHTISTLEQELASVT